MHRKDQRIGSKCLIRFGLSTSALNNELKLSSTTPHRVRKWFSKD